jgi:hypothetical protein
MHKTILWLERRGRRRAQNSVFNVLASGLARASEATHKNVDSPMEIPKGRMADVKRVTDEASPRQRRPLERGKSIYMSGAEAGLAG